MSVINKECITLHKGTDDIGSGGKVRETQTRVDKGNRVHMLRNHCKVNWTDAFKFRFNKCCPS